MKHWLTYRNGKTGGHAVEVVGMLTHGHDLWYNCVIRPLNTENLGQLLQVLSGCFSDGEDGVAQPAHTQAAELLVKELDTKL